MRISLTARVLACLAILTGALCGAPAGSLAASGHGAANPCHLARLHLRCPDLIMSAPREMEFDRSTHPGRVLLRATSSVNNRGSGPLEIRARREGYGQWRVYQVIYDRRGRPHLYASGAQLVFKHISGERYGYGYVGDASYWKLRHLAAFQLWSINRDFRALRLVRTGPKVDYCLRDLFRTNPTGDSPLEPVYPGCKEDPDLQQDTFGTSVGWSDVYPDSYPEQWIDVTGLHGRFAYVQRADPDQHFIEISRRNNLSETYIELPSGRILGHRVGVSRP
jgi:hypothetical protein